MLDDIIYPLTKGKPFVFIIMKYNTEDFIHTEIEKVVKNKFRIPCIRADQVRSSGYDLLAKVHMLIERAEVIIADISVDSSNVYYEIGYAVGKGKRPIITVNTTKKEEVPVDLRGLEVIQYNSENKKDINVFKKDLTEHLKFRFASSNALLRDMLIPSIPRELFIVASPRYPREDDPTARQVRDIRTYGDFLGVMGLLTAFGSTIGESNNVEFVSGQYAGDDLLTRPANLFMIGSQKSNPPVGVMLKWILKGKDPSWSFEQVPTHQKGEHRTMVLYRHQNGKKILEESTLGDFKGREIWQEDYGLIVRAPHPLHPDRMVLVMAGAHSLGTGAACIAATSSRFIREIQKNHLDGKVLADKTQTFWVLVKGIASERDGLLDKEGVTICEAGVYAEQSSIDKGIVTN